ncbi:MAG: histidinol phosphatase, partial [Micrococcales bacterium]|nr:histidinol phosphatase [Micrococcales bacterium]
MEAAGQVQPEPDTYLADLRLAMTLADQADQITMSRFRADDLDVWDKDDETPVTDADRDTETLL